MQVTRFRVGGRPIAGVAVAQQFWPVRFDGAISSTHYIIELHTAGFTSPRFPLLPTNFF